MFEQSTLSNGTPQHCYGRYTNIQFAAALSLAKAFVDAAWGEFGSASAVTMRRSDLDALIGVSAATEFIKSARRFLDDAASYDFGKHAKVRSHTRKPKYTTFAAVIDELKRGYQEQLARQKSRVGVHHYISYDDLFSSYPDPVELSEHLDYYCDFGILVPGTFIKNGCVLRGCRTGEPDGDYNWKRTQILIHLAIDQLRGAVTKSTAVEPTVVNKLLANFVFDYPSEVHHELHCLFGEPYHFGTLVRVHHRHRAPTNPSIYESDRIGPRLYKWDESRRGFVAKRPRNLASEVRAYLTTRNKCLSPRSSRTSRSSQASIATSNLSTFLTCCRFAGTSHTFTLTLPTTLGLVWRNS